MRKLIERITTDNGIDITFEYDTDKDIYLLTIIKDGNKSVFEGSMEEIQKASYKFFISSIKNLKNQVEVFILEELYRKS